MNLTVVSGYAECFVALTARALLRIATRLLGLLEWVGQILNMAHVLNCCCGPSRQTRLRAMRSEIHA